MISRTPIQPPTDVAGYDPVATAGDCTFDAEAAQLAVDFFPTFLQHVKGKIAGEPFVLNPWELDFVVTLCGWKRPNGTRRYREAFVGIPRKNDKTTLCAGLALFFLACDREAGAEVYLAAGDKEQASLCYSIASAMAKSSPELAGLLKIRDSYKVMLKGISTLKAIPADAAGSHGFNASVAILDEVHTQPNRDLYDVLKSSMGARTQPLLLSITTAGFDKESICWELWEYAEKVRSGEIVDPSFLPCLYQIPTGAAWDDPKSWAIANPNLGRSIGLDFLEAECARARSTPAYENTFRRLYLNQWTESDTRWISTEAWNDCEGEVPDLEGCECIAGLDLASTDDLTALVYVFPLKGKYYVKAHYWCPEDTIRNRPKKYQLQYHRWLEKDLIHTTPGSETRYEFIRKQIMDDAKRYKIRHVMYDEYQARDTVHQLEEKQISCVKVSQNHAGMWPGVKAVEESVADKTLVHDGDEILRWMLSCTVLTEDPNGNRKPDRKKSQGEHHNRGKIDGIAALVMAMSQARAPVQDNAYNRRGVLTL